VWSSLSFVARLATIGGLKCNAMKTRLANKLVVKKKKKKRHLHM
jgi:hypothetical protein